MSGLVVRHQDRWLIVVDKPHGVPSQPGRGGGGGDVFTELQRQHRYVGLHHRLDQPASGVILLALDPEVNAVLSEAFRTHAVARTYAAVLAGAWRPGERRALDAPIDGDPARSDVDVLGARDGLLAARLVPQTGRLHQLRRHVSAAGAPILGDRRYGGDVGSWWPRLCLHATRLALTHPVTGLPLVVDSPIPGDMTEAWRRAGGPIHGAAPPA